MDWVKIILPNVWTMTKGHSSSGPSFFWKKGKAGRYNQDLCPSSPSHSSITSLGYGLLAGEIVRKRIHTVTIKKKEEIQLYPFPSKVAQAIIKWVAKNNPNVFSHNSGKHKL